MSSSCDTSGDESDNHRPEKFPDGVGRSYYECTFCKRGFTNAQALGGHMNIHRKDKLKAKPAFKKQQQQEEEELLAISRKSNSNNTHKDQEVSTHQISSQQQDFYYPSSRAYVTFHQLFHLPSANPSYKFHVMDQQRYYRNFALHEDANLSLRIGSPDYEERKEEHIEVSEVDLELRLGPNSI